MELSKERYEKIEQELRVFSFSHVQALLTLMGLLKSRGIVVKEVEVYLEMKRKFEETKEQKQREYENYMREIWNKNTRKCPVCMKPLMVRPISIPKGKGNIKGYTCHWFCQEESCNFEEYTYEDFQETYRKIMGG